MKNRLKFEKLAQRLALTAIGFTPHEIVSSETRFSVVAGDWDSDDHFDLIVGLRADSDATPTPFASHPLWHYEMLDKIWVPEPLGHATWPSQFDLADLNADAITDLINFDGWFEQDGSVGEFDPIRRGGPAGAVASADVDGDGDIDVITGGHIGGVSGITVDGETVWQPNVRLAWYMNDGQGSFGPPITIQEILSAVIVDRIQPIDIDQDGDLDLLETSPYSGNPPGGIPFTNPGVVSLYTNNGAGEFEANILVPRASQGRTPAWSRATDFDNDGDFDILYYHGSSIQEGLTLSLLENRDGDFYDQKLDIFGPFRSAEVSDLDDDGFADILVATSDSVSWYRGLGDRAFAAPQQIAVGNLSPYQSVQDIDLDGDLDVLVQHDAIENEDGTQQEPYRLVWYESDLVETNEHRLLGDVDNDGEVGFADFLILSQNFGQQADAAFADGDLDADGAVSFADFLILSENFGRSF